ncbi:hypothetical protein [Streptomyces ziwulingensis]|uniref:Uncharacterized protein n=1 Tax=Streptomyces ziwulingensis TaxID=1045501 RepID=A0ABP9D085_9ACTN
MTGPEPSAELVADIDEVFLGYWPEDLQAIFREPYSPGVLLGYAHRDGGIHLPDAS